VIKITFYNQLKITIYLLTYLLTHSPDVVGK